MTWRPRKLLKEAFRFVGYGLAFALLMTVAARLAGYSVSIHPTWGWTHATSIVELGDPAAQDLLVNDFPADARARNVILLIADGMGLSQITAARSELGGLSRRLSFERMPVTGFLMTHDAGAIVTDSAASATALATGVKTVRGRLGMTPDGAVLKTVAEGARERGMAVGMVTDSYLWDATPAAFLTHVGSRRDYAEVAAQMARSVADVLFGELVPDLEDDSRRTILDGFREGGYTVVRDWSEIQTSGEVAGTKLAGLFDSGTIADPDRPPGLPQLARYARERLAASPAGFFLLVETEETDTASHRRQFRRLVRGIETLDEVAADALEFARRDRSTLVLVTADHETGGLALVSGRYGNKLGLRWTTPSHSGGLVPIYAYGPGAENFSGSRDNTEVATILAEILGFQLDPDGD